MSSVFSKIIQGTIPCEKVHEDQDFIAFLDIRPIKPGHILIVPKQEIDELFDLPNDLLSSLMVFAKPISQSIKQVFNCSRVGVIVAGLEVPHAHMHLVPIDTEGELSFSNARSASSHDLKTWAHQIREALKDNL